MEYINGNFFLKGKKINETIINGYIYLVFSNFKKRKHRVVWEFFNGEIKNGLYINHKDGNKLNNDLSNLELSTPKENTKHWFENLNNSNLIENFKGVKIAACCLKDKKTYNFETVSEASKKLNINNKSISTVLKNKQKTTNNYVFAYTAEELNEKIKNVNPEKLKQYKLRPARVRFANFEVEEFKSLRDCSEALGIKVGNIRRYVTGERVNKDKIKFELI
ncbi:MAG: HNH endonuclease signature motif containing protein [Fusobacteriaceae bacterium]